MPSETLMTAVRRQLADGDPAAIVDLHDRVYRAEYGVDGRFAASVAASVEASVARGWPRSAGAVWLIDLDERRRLGGALGLTDEGAGVGRVRWFVLAPALRGHGLGHALLGELLGAARGFSMHTLTLETFSALTAAAHLYRALGFRLCWEEATDKWGPAIVYQGYELAL
jgi:GNAT superfamily N-acetyltransferase